MAIPHLESVMSDLPRRALILAVPALLLPRAARAHHGWGSYDAESPLELTGTIEAMSFDWPHAGMHLAASDRVWEVVLAPPSRTRARGLTEEVARIGRECTVMGYPHRTRETEIRVEWVRVGDDTFRMR
jgi:hypothetical protein